MPHRCKAFIKHEANRSIRAELIRINSGKTIQTNQRSTQQTNINMVTSLVDVFACCYDI